jgi:hypothetical protein
MNSPARVKERAEEQSSSMTTDQQTVIRMLANDLHRLNYTVMKAVEAGVSVELVRSARHHGATATGETCSSPSSSPTKNDDDPDTAVAAMLTHIAFGSDRMSKRAIVGKIR